MTNPLLEAARRERARPTHPALATMLEIAATIVKAYPDDVMVYDANTLAMNQDVPGFFWSVGGNGSHLVLPNPHPTRGALYQITGLADVYRRYQPYFWTPDQELIPISYPEGMQRMRRLIIEERDKGVHRWRPRPYAEPMRVRWDRPNETRTMYGTLIVGSEEVSDTVTDHTNRYDQFFYWSYNVAWDQGGYTRFCATRLREDAWNEHHMLIVVNRC